MANPTDSRITGVYAGILSLVEIGLGSLLHGLKIPFGGTFLSLNQSLFLTRLIKLNSGVPEARTLAFRVSNITALLKSLSPAGKKLFPMLAISVQGFLFSLGTFLLGANLWGCLMGSVISSAWGVFQPLAVMWVIYGTTFEGSQLEKFLAYVSHLLGGLVALTPALLWEAVLVFLLIKALLAFGLTWFGWKIPFNEQDLLNQKLLNWGLKGLPASPEKPGSSHPALGALRDLTRPFLLISFGLTALFFFFAEDSKASFVWFSLRPVAIAYLFFLAIRLFPVDSWIKKRGLGGSALASALEFIEGRSKPKDSRD